MWVEHSQGGWSLIIELHANLLRAATSMHILIIIMCFLFLLQEVVERDPECIQFGVRYCHGMQWFSWVQSTCSVSLEPVSLTIFLSMSLLMMCSSQLTRLS